MNLYSPHHSAARASTRVRERSVLPQTVCGPPSADLAPYISGYYRYATDAVAKSPHRAALRPGDANLWLVVSGTGWRVRPTTGKWLTLGPVSLFGPTSALVWSEAQTCVVLGASIRPCGWLRLVDQPAGDWANRIDQSPAFAGCDLQAFHEQLCGLEDNDAVPQIFDRLFHDVMGPAPRHEEAVGRVEGALLDPEISTVSQLAETTGLTVRSLERVAYCAFGFAPKLLLRRARFLRSLDAMRRASPERRASEIEPTYTDYSHFVRDSHDFLGVAPQAFLKMDLPLLNQCDQGS